MQTTTGRPGLRQGSIFGASAGAVYLVLYAVLGVAHILGLSTIIDVIALVAIVVLAIVAGLRAASQTGKVSSGVLAGTFVGLLMSVLGSLGALIFDYLNIDSLVNAANEAIKQAEKQAGTSTGITYTHSSFLLVALGGSVLAIIFEVVIGLAAGAIGGAIGKGRAPKPAPAAYQDSFYGGGVPPTAPIYPPQMPPQAGYPPMGAPPAPQQPQQEYPTNSPLQ